MNSGRNSLVVNSRKHRKIKREKRKLLPFLKNAMIVSQSLSSIASYGLTVMITMRFARERSWLHWESLEI